MSDTAKWHRWVRRWTRRALRNEDFIELASTIDRRDDAVCLVHGIGSPKSINRTIARAFLAIAK